jgi:hypothetical protein
VTSYLGDNDGWYPPSDKWSDSLVPHLPIDALEKWLVKDKQTGLSIMYNSGLKGKHEAETENPNTVVFFLSKNGGWNKSGSAKDVHSHDFGKKAKDTCVIVFADGRTVAVKLSPETKKKLIWSIKTK